MAKKKTPNENEIYLVGSEEVEITPDGRIVSVGKGKDRGMKGLPIPPHTFY